MTDLPFFEHRLDGIPMPEKLPPEALREAAKSVRKGTIERTPPKRSVYAEPRIHNP